MNILSSTILQTDKDKFMTFIQVIYKQSQVGSLFTLIPGMEFISQRIIARINMTVEGGRYKLKSIKVIKQLCLKMLQS